MRLSLKRKTVVFTVLVLLGIVAITIYKHRLRQAEALLYLYDENEPIPPHAPSISAGFLQQLTSADFTVVRDTKYLPLRVKESFCNIEQCNWDQGKFAMVNPGETMSTDYILSGVPNKRLVFAALNKNSAIIVYEQGGFANTLRATILDFKDLKSWDTTLDHRIRNLGDLRTALIQGNLR